MPKGGIQKLRWPDFGHFWPPSYHWLTFSKKFLNFYERKSIDRWHIPHHLPTPSCQRSFWMPPKTVNFVSAIPILSKVISFESSVHLANAKLLDRKLKLFSYTKKNKKKFREVYRSKSSVIYWAIFNHCYTSTNFLLRVLCWVFLIRSSALALLIYSSCSIPVSITKTKIFVALSRLFMI